VFTQARAPWATLLLLVAKGLLPPFGQPHQGTQVGEAPTSTLYDNGWWLANCPHQWRVVRYGYLVWVFGMGIWYGYLVWVFGMGIWYAYSLRIFATNIRYEYSLRIFATNSEASEW